MRVAQLIFTQAFRAKLHTVETLNVTTRGEGGFGSTGLHSKLAGE
jgi:dUTPase